MININKIKDFVKKEKAVLKQSKLLKTEQKVYEHKPVFVKLVENVEKKVRICF